MLKIAVFCGGTGSVALQKGFASLYGIDRVQMDIIVNAYDNGKSTGTCRRVFHNKILGPSDVRKNQLLQYEIRYADEMQDKTSGKARLFQLFNIRLSASEPEEYYKIAQKELYLCKDILDTDTYKYLNGLLDFFFFESGNTEKKTLRSSISGESFVDFALSNIFYAACAAKNGNTLEKAMDYMAKILGLKDSVHLISDKSLLLKAETQLGRVIEDEGDIVTWDNPNDKIVRAILSDGSSEYIPFVGEDSNHITHPISKIIDKADILIFSSGTQWSSLIPTYMHQGFREKIKASSAKKYLIMNNAEDHDAIGVSAQELCGILERYLDIDQMTIVLNENASQSMNQLPQKYKTIRRKLSESGSKKHIPEKLAWTILADYYGQALNCHHQLFDLDGTLWDVRGTDDEKKVGAENLLLFQGPIVTGNNQEHVRQALKDYIPADKIVEVYADYGNSYFTSAEPEKVTYLTDRYFIDARFKEMIDHMEPFARKTQLRGDTVITIKPLDDRERLASELESVLRAKEIKLAVKQAGRTSIDVTCEGYTKAEMVRLIMKKRNISREDVVFIGNEIQHGSEEDIPH